MISEVSKHLVFAFVLVIGAASAQAAVHAPSDSYTGSQRATYEQRDKSSDGVRTIQEQRAPKQHVPQ